MIRKNPFKEYEELGEERVREGLAAGNYGRPDSEMYRKASGWLSMLDKQREDDLAARRDSREAEALSISRKALLISESAKKWAIIAIIVSAITAIITAIIQID